MSQPRTLFFEHDPANPGLQHLEFRAAHDFGFARIHIAADAVIHTSTLDYSQRDVVPNGRVDSVECNVVDRADGEEIFTCTVTRQRLILDAKHPKERMEDHRAILLHCKDLAAEIFARGLTVACFAQPAEETEEVRTNKALAPKHRWVEAQCASTKRRSRA